MPELPEVETIMRTLRDGVSDGLPLPGRTIQYAEVLWRRTLAEPAYAEFVQRIRGQRIERLGRRGKFALLHLTQDTLLIHLRMSGDLRVEPGVDQAGAPVPLQPHDRAVFVFTGGVRLAFNDARKFGRIWLVSDPETVTSGLGPEPFGEDLTPLRFYHMLRAHRRQLKPLLLDQTFLAGLGNIYTDEALHLAGMHPARLAHTLDQAQAERLLDAIRTVLQRGIQAHGASIDWVYRGGDYQNEFRVYQRTGLPCPTCGTPVERTVFGQRGTHFCPICQPAPA
ncbi:MAG TPA: bifunctional DNA-formamidopyrimidine glycosylase/DNA-(apurinic or apyrimidinic site) lyase [Levilinea sp.]|nr:bifunctional DNA-formamidopyrimidine glycosylase/DNA-(apurinic or apyrimidinic site) lyase [Levilinea sp.]